MLRMASGGVSRAPGLFQLVGSGLARNYVLADLREGMLSLHGLGPLTRLVVRLALLLLLTTSVGLISSDVWRDGFPLIALPSGTVGRGSLLPTALIPVTLFLFSVAWSLWLVGVRAAHPVIRLGGLSLYLFVAGSWAADTPLGSPIPRIVSMIGMALVIGAFVVLWRRPPRPALEFGFFFTILSTMYVVQQRQGLSSWALSDSPQVAAQLAFQMQSLSWLISPLLLFAGLGIAGFARQTAGWAAGLCALRTPSVVLVGLCGAVLLWRLVLIAQEIRDGEVWPLAYLGGAVTVLLLVGTWALTSGALSRRASDGLPEDEQVTSAAHRVAMPAILLYLAIQLAFLAVGMTLYALSSAGIFTGDLDQERALFNLAATAQAQIINVIVVSLILAAVAVRLVRRRRRDVALYLAVLSVWISWVWLTSAHGPFRVLVGGSRSPAMEPAALALLMALVGVWAVQGRLNRERLHAVLLVVLTLALLRQTDFLSSRFSPLLGSFGVLFLAIGVAWDSLTMGEWANTGGRFMPRLSRVFLYLGYALLSVTVVHWAVALHDVATVGRLTGESSLIGFEFFGRPMVYASLLALLGAAGKADP